MQTLSSRSHWRSAAKPLAHFSVAKSSLYYFLSAKCLRLSSPPINFAHVIPHLSSSCLTCPLFFLELQTLWLIGSGVLCNDFALCGERWEKSPFISSGITQVTTWTPEAQCTPPPCVQRVKTAKKKERKKESCRIVLIPGLRKSHRSIYFLHCVCACTHLSYCVLPVPNVILLEGSDFIQPAQSVCAARCFPLSKRKQTRHISPIRQRGWELLRSHRQNSI